MKNKDIKIEIFGKTEENEGLERKILIALRMKYNSFYHDGDEYRIIRSVSSPSRSSVKVTMRKTGD